MSAKSNPSGSVIIIGAGIVGSALAAVLSQRPDHDDILVIDRCITGVIGSTGYAPGLLGQFHQSRALTALAVASLKEYSGLPSFRRTGGLEFASSEDGIERLRQRHEKAKQYGLEAQLLTADEAIGHCPASVRKDSLKPALFFPTDGVADPSTLCSGYREVARRNGVRFMEASIASLIIHDSRVKGVVTAAGGHHRAAHVVCAAGIWTASLVQDVVDFPVPVIPVNHPYSYSVGSDSTSATIAFCRWPEKHVYARDHGRTYGIGSYDHASQMQLELGETAKGPWNSVFTQAIDLARQTTAAGLDDTRKSPAAQERQVGGIFAVTPDNLPLIGPVRGASGLWLAAAVWVTHAAGAARMLEAMICGDDWDSDVAEETRPDRFSGRAMGPLQEEALSQYNDIYRSRAES